MTEQDRARTIQRLKWREWVFTCQRCRHVMVRFCKETTRPRVCYDCTTVMEKRRDDRRTSDALE